MRYKIIRSSLVEHDLENIQDYIASVGGVRSASRISREINSTILKLSDFPHVGTVRHDIMPNLRAIPAAEKATICFTINDETRTVKIVCIAYAGQNWQAIARDRE